MGSVCIGGVQRWTCADPFILLLGKTILPHRRTEAGLDFSAIPYLMPTNDNLRTKDRLSARCGNLLRLLVGLHSLRAIRLKQDPTQRHPRDGQRGPVTRGFGLTSTRQIALKTSSKS